MGLSETLQVSDDFRIILISAPYSFVAGSGNTMEQSLWKVSCSGSKIPCILWNQKDHYHVQVTIMDPYPEPDEYNAQLPVLSL
jgi:hypothetical protein